MNVEPGESEAHVDTLKVGIVGAGWMGHVHARAWAATPRAARWSPSPMCRRSGRVEHLAAECDDGEVAIYADLETMLAEVDLDAVDICLPHHLHTEAIVAAARAGKAILCENRSA